MTKEEILAILKDVEWGTEDKCPSCKSYLINPHGPGDHLENCRLDALIRKVRKGEYPYGNKLNLNSRVRVKLTPKGNAHYLKKLESFGILKQDVRLPAADAEGYVAFPLWDFANLFGECFVIGFPDQVIDKNTILIKEEQ